MHEVQDRSITSVYQNAGQLSLACVTVDKDAQVKQRPDLRLVEGQDAIKLQATKADIRLWLLLKLVHPVAGRTMTTSARSTCTVCGSLLLVMKS